MKSIYAFVFLAMMAFTAAFRWLWHKLRHPTLAIAMPTSTSSIAAAIAVEGMVLQIGNGSSPQVYNSICNVQDWAEPDSSEVVDITNVGDSYRRRIPTLLDLGKMKFKIFWVMTEPTHANSIQGGITGLRYLWRNSILTAFQVVYPVSATQQAVDQFAGYITGFSITGKVGGVFEAEVEFTANTGAPVLA